MPSQSGFAGQVNMVSAWEFNHSEEGDKQKTAGNATAPQAWPCRQLAPQCCSDHHCLQQPLSNNLCNPNPLPWLQPGNEEQFLSRTLVDISSAG